MNFLILFKVAIRNLRRAFLRSSLTMLGIVIGVGTVIAMVGIGNGAKQKMAKLLANLDANRVIVYAQAPRAAWRDGIRPMRHLGDGLTLADYNAIKERVPGITSMSLDCYAALGEVRANGRKTSPRIQGANLDTLATQPRAYVDGCGFGESDVTNAATVCVITQSVARDLFDDAPAVGRLLQIRQTPFLIIGVLADDNSQSQFGGPMRDTVVFVPYTSVLLRLDRNAELIFTVKSDTPLRLQGVADAIEDLLEERRGSRTYEFHTTDLAKIVQSWTSGMETMTLLLATIAAISLLVGGIGIMNIMLVSVTERTREIGIRLAIGTRERDILRQFIFEAAILSVAGGLVGIGLGVIATTIMTKFYGWTTELTTVSILGAFATSAAIGVFFGWYPALKASRLNPIEALRYE